MTTTAFDDQFASATETILARNVRDECQQVHDLQVRLAAAIQRATDAEAELARLREQKPVRWHVRGNYFHDGDAAILFASMNSTCGAKVEQLYAAPVPANQPQSGVLAVPAEWRDAVGAALGLLENTTCESGVCMCGDSVIGHADFSVGHSACDSGTYHQIGVIEQLRALLQSAEVHPDDKWQLTPAPTHPADRDAREVHHD